ncbi:MAG TPA: C40 family peptidase [Gammaproteobacteria bacterium]|nr:C40 family peptidase [Gammaproteobacteria bacterium]
MKSACWIVCLSLGLCACAPWPERPDAAQPALQTVQGNRVVELARSELGVPYLYGGETPDGFDCSGLVQYVYAHAGIEVPRTANAQLYASHPVKRQMLRPGDLVFFEIAGNAQMHVGIYIGDGRFIHAPETGGKVSYAQLDNPYWKAHFISGGRFQ